MIRSFVDKPIPPVTVVARTLVKQFDLDYGQLASSAGIARGTLKAKMSGSRALTLNVVSAICRMTNVSAEQFQSLVDLVRERPDWSGPLPVGEIGAPKKEPPDAPAK